MNYPYLRSLVFVLVNATIYFGLYSLTINLYHARYQHSRSQDDVHDSFTGSSKSRGLIDINVDDRGSQPSLSDEEQIEVEKSLQSYLAELQRARQKKSFASEDDVIEINTYWHVFSPNGTEGDINDDLINRQFEVLNGAYAGNISTFSPCFDSFIYDESTLVKTPFRFVLKEIIRYSFESEPWLDFSNERFESRRGNCSDLNIYSGTRGIFRGESTLPWNCEEFLERDGVSINYETMPGGTMENFNQGDNLVQQVGRWLGLYQTSVFGCDGRDYVLDTSPQQFNTNGCPLGKNSCSGAGRDPIHNYMDGSYDCCKYRFTNGQTERMILAAGLYRNLTANVSLPEPSFPICGFPEDGFNYSECKVDDPCMVRNGECDSSSGYNTSECNYDGRDCLCEYPIDGFNYSLCDAEVPCQLGDGVCNLEYFTETCNLDGNDCCAFPDDGFDYSSCTTNRTCSIRDFCCDEDLNTEECNFDSGDCVGNPDPFFYLILLFSALFAFPCFAPCTVPLIACLFDMGVTP